MKIRCLSNGLYIHGANVGKTPKYHFSGTEFVFLVPTTLPPPRSPPHKTNNKQQNYQLDTIQGSKVQLMNE